MVVFLILILGSFSVVFSSCKDSPLCNTMDYVGGYGWTAGQQCVITENDTRHLYEASYWVGEDPNPDNLHPAWVYVESCLTQGGPVDEPDLTTSQLDALNETMEFNTQVVIIMCGLLVGMIIVRTFEYAI